MVLSPLSRCGSRANGVEIEVQNFVEHLLIGLVRGCLEQIAMVAPERVHEQHRAQHARGDGRIDLAEFPGAHATLEDACHQAQNALDDLASVEAGQVGKVAELRVNQPEEGREVR